MTESSPALPKFDPFVVRATRRGAVIFCVILSLILGSVFALLTGVGLQPRQMSFLWAPMVLLALFTILNTFQGFQVDHAGVERRLGPWRIWKLVWQDVSVCGVLGRMLVLRDRFGKLRRISMTLENAEKLVEIAQFAVDPAAYLARRNAQARVANAAESLREWLAETQIADGDHTDTARRRLYFLSAESLNVWIPTSGGLLPPVCINCLAPKALSIPYVNVTPCWKVFGSAWLHQPFHFMTLNLPFCSACRKVTYRPDFVLQVPFSFRFMAWSFGILSLVGLVPAALAPPGVAWTLRVAVLVVGLLAAVLPACIVWHAIQRPSPRQLAEIISFDPKRGRIGIRFGNSAYAKLVLRLADLQSLGVGDGTCPALPE